MRGSNGSGVDEIILTSSTAILLLSDILTDMLSLNLATFLLNGIQ